MYTLPVGWMEFSLHKLCNTQWNWWGAILLDLHWPIINHVTQCLTNQWSLSSVCQCSTPKTDWTDEIPECIWWWWFMLLKQDYLSKRAIIVGIEVCCVCLSAACSILTDRRKERGVLDLLSRSRSMYFFNGNSILCHSMYNNSIPLHWHIYQEIELILIINKKETKRVCWLPYD